MLTLHHGNRLEHLADALAELVRQPAAAPLVPEVVLVQHAGMARWLSLRLAAANGICAGVRFVAPGVFVWEVLRAVVPGLPGASPFEVDVLCWRIAAVLAHAAPQDARFAPVAAYLAAGAPGEDADVRRLALARRLAILLDQYTLYRPQWTLAWDDGHAADDWQAELWRQVVAAAGVPHRARLQREALAALAGGRVPATLPPRVLVFGIPALPPQDLQLLHALSAGTDVRLFLMNPCREYATHVRSLRTVARLAGDRSPEDLLLDVGNPLLASMGRQPIELVERVLELDGDLVASFHEPDGGHLLAAVQADILHLRRRGRAPGDAPPLPVAPDDASIRLHVCHAPMREVQVLQDQLLHLFATHPELQPSDVVVMAPDVERYAPCFEAVRAATPETRRIPFTIADIGVRAERPLVDTFLRLLEIPASRFEVDRVLALLDAAAVRRRFGLDDADVEQIATWVREAGIHWGRDAAARHADDLPDTAEHTWRFGLDRLLLGYAMPGNEAHLFTGILPFDDLEGSGARPLGALAAFAAALADVAERLAAPRPMAAWKEDLRALLDRFFDADADDDDAAVAVREAIAALADAAARAGHLTPVSRAAVVAELEASLATRSAGGRFFAGAVTVCRLVPMRSVPFEVVCLLGMDVTSFPRADVRPGFDRLAAHRQPGDRSRRDDDRTLFLEALLSARRHLHVSWVGRSIRDNAAVPPSVLVGELLDYLDAACEPPAGVRRLRDHVVVEHRLQAFSRRYFDGSSRLFSHDDALCAAVAAARGALRRSTPLVQAPLPPLGPDGRTVTVHALASFFANTSRALLEGRLGLRVPREREVPQPREPFRLDALGGWDVDRQLVALRGAGCSVTDATALLRARGALPHGALGDAAVRARLLPVDALVQRLADELPPLPPPPLAVDVAVGDFRLVGELDGVGARGRVAWRVGGTRPQDRVGAWVRHLALQLVAPGPDARHTRWIDRDGGFALAPVADPLAHLAALLDCWWDGLHRLVPFFPAASWACVTDRAGFAAARRTWIGGQQQRGECEDAWHRLAWRDVVPLDDAFAALATHVYAPLRAHLTEAGS